MSRRDTSRDRTLRLLEQWTKDTHRRERMIRAIWWKDRWGTLLRLSRPRLEARMSGTARELGHRYQGVLYEIFETAAVPPDRRTLKQIEVWQWTQARVRRDPEAWRVPGLLWAACVAAVPPGAFLPTRLKRKLMLRAFIEEVPRSPARETLLRLAYLHQGASLADTTKDEQALEAISRLYPPLHAALLRLGERLSDWSDGALTAQTVAALVPPYAEFDDWLFDMGETAGESYG